jgi:hypothetical protein
MAEDYALLFLEGERAGRAFALAKDEVTLGRSRTNDLTFNDQLLSRQHLFFRREGGEIMVEDPGSTHGAFLNEKRLRGILSLNEGDVLQAGSQKMRLVRLAEVRDLVDQPAADGGAVLDEAAAAAEAEAAEELDKTNFADEQDVQETRYHAVDDVRYDEEDDDRTRVLQDQSTRMLDVDELQGLKAAQPAKTPRTKVALGAVLLLLLGGAAGYLVYRNMNAGSQASGALVTYPDEQHAFRLRYPGTWLKSTSYADALIGFELVEDKKPVARLKVYVDRSGSYPLKGLTVGFENHKAEVLQDRYPNLKITGQKLLDVNRVRVINYRFRSDTMEGYGLFTINGVTRFDVEASATRARFGVMADELIELLGTFKLDEEQRYADFPLPDEAIRHLALSDPEKLTGLARTQMELARDLLARRQIRQENLYRAVVEYRGAMQKLTALSTRPPFYEQTATGLADAIALLREAVEDVKFSITMAEKTRDYETIGWGVAQLMQMVPDKNDPVYRFARETQRKYRL